MELRPTPVPGCYEIRTHSAVDGRGSFTKLFQRSVFETAGAELDVAELFVSRSRAGVVRGLHFQRPPADVMKLVVCLEGAVLDGVVDLRTDSPSYGRSVVLRLSAADGNAVLVPRGCGHGFFVEEGEALVAYAQSGEHDPVLEGGIHWSSAGLPWPPAGFEGPVVVSDRDASFEPFDAFDSPFRTDG